MKEIILAYQGEMSLKGLNRATFESVLLKTMRRRLKSLGNFKIYKAQSTMYAEPAGDEDIDAAEERIGKIFGIAAISRAAVCPKDFAVIADTAKEYLCGALRAAKTFKVSAKRSDKTFPMDSMEIARELGGVLLSAYPHLKVDVHHPDVNVTVEIRDFAAYVHGGKKPGAGGLPVSTSGKAALMLSGGIDSPVAAYMMAKRGLSLACVHFASPPYTSERARMKVLTLAKKLTPYTGNLNVYVVPYTAAQEHIRDNAPEDLFTVLMRRSMMRIARVLCEKESCGRHCHRREPGPGGQPDAEGHRLHGRGPEPACAAPAASAWTRRRSPTSHGRSTPTRRASCPMRTAAPSSRRPTRKRSPIWMRSRPRRRACRGWLSWRHRPRRRLKWCM